MWSGFNEEDIDEYINRKNQTSVVENDVIDEEMNEIMQSKLTVENSSSHQQDSVPEKSVIDKSNSGKAKNIQYRAAPVTIRRRSVRIQEKSTSLGEPQSANNTTEQPPPSDTKNARERKSKGNEDANRNTKSAKNVFADEFDYAEVTLNYANRKRKRSGPKKDSFSALVQQYFTGQTEMHIVVGDKVVKNSQLCATCTLCGESRQYQRSSVWNLRKHLKTVRKN